jgi:hypothetical protein
MKVKVFLSASLSSSSSTGSGEKEFVVENNGYRLEELKAGRVEVSISVRESSW